MRARLEHAARPIVEYGDAVEPPGAGAGARRGNGYRQPSAPRPRRRGRARRALPARVPRRAAAPEPRSPRGDARAVARCAAGGRGRARRVARVLAGRPTRRPSASWTTAPTPGCWPSSTSPPQLDAPPVRVKAQITGPLTLGAALVDGRHVEPHAGVPARRRGRARAWAVALEELVAARLPDTGLVLFLDEPALVQWRRGDAAARPRSGDRRAVGRARGSRLHHRRARVRRRRPRARARSGSAGDRHRGAPRARASTRVALARFLDGDGWIAWGAVPTDRPVGESADPHWRTLAEVWCELTRRGCDPVPLRTRGMITPRVALRATVPRRPSGCSGSHGSWRLGSTIRPSPPDSCLGA